MGLNHACIRGQAMAFDLTRRSTLVANQMHWWWFIKTAICDASSAVIVCCFSRQEARGPKSVK